MSLYNRFYANNQWRPPRMMNTFAPPRPIGGRHVSITENITIKNGPQGFWGFMGGLFSGLGMGGGLFGCGGGLFGGGLFGCGGLGGGMGVGPFGGLGCGGGLGGLLKNNNAAGANNELSNLKTIYSKHSVVQDPKTGEYILTKGNGDVIKGTYQELVDRAKGTDNQGLTTNSEDLDKTETDKAKNVKTENTDTNKTNTQTEGNPDNAVKNNQTGKTEGDPNNKINENPDNEETNSTNSKNNTSDVNDTAQGVSTTKSGRTGAAQRAQGAYSAQSSKSPKGWYRANNINEGKIAGLLTPGSSGLQVLNKILQGKMDYLSNADRQLLAQELIRKNPSIFDANGKVREGADLGKLDIPSVQYIKDNYVKNAKQLKNGKVQYERKKADNAASKEHGTRNSEYKTIKGQNGYYAVKAKDGWHYYTPSGNAISGAEFKKHCPSIYDSTIKEKVQSKSPGYSGTNNGYMGSHMRR